MNTDAIDKLLCILVSMLKSNFMAGLNLETLFSTGNIVREDAKEKTDHLVLIGASHLKRPIPHL
jgi:hypothetical protein